jgi:hypothetical protein
MQTNLRQAFPRSLRGRSTSQKRLSERWNSRLPPIHCPPFQCEIVAAPSNWTMALQSLFPKNVPLMRCLGSRFSGHRSVERDSHKTFEFSARKSCFKKRMRIRDEPTGGSHQTVVFRESHADSRVERWRGGTGEAYLFPGARPF